MTEIKLTMDGQRAMAEAEALAEGASIAIQSAEHLLAGALLVLGEAGWRNLPGPKELAAALDAVHGHGESALTDKVMPGPTYRRALNLTVGAVREDGGTTVDALVLASGAIASGEVSPTFYEALGVARETLTESLEGGAPPREGS